MALSPRARLGPGEILAAHGAGATGELYRARDTSLGSNVAVPDLLDGRGQDAVGLAPFEASR